MSAGGVGEPFTERGGRDRFERLTPANPQVLARRCAVSPLR